MNSALIISGWAHGIEAIKPLGDALAECFEVKLLTGAQVLRERAIPYADFIVTGSMGGILAMELLPTACKKLVLLSSTARFCAAEDYPHGTPDRILRRMIAQLKRDPAAVLNEFFKNVHYPQRESRKSIQLRNAETITEQSFQDLVDGLEYLLTSDVREKVAAITIPILLIHGREDRIIPCGAAEWLHEHLPDSRLQLIDGGGHALAAHHFSTVVAQIRAFLHQHDA
ncbi:MAG: alpha/beta fold hydrolase [Lentisphaerae bacterium]|nr:alpha/beta fold hydrolase [Lentisphaerota bacterium]